jgi:hypothetical protein
MSRFVLFGAVAGAPPNTPYRQWPTGTTIADSSGNAVAGDLVWPALAAAPNNKMAPLDASGAAAMVIAAAANPSAVGGWVTAVGGVQCRSSGNDSVSA